MLTIKILISSGKTRFVENLIQHKKLGFQPRRILYLYPEGLGFILFNFFNFSSALSTPPVNWDIIFPEIPVEYDTGISPDKDYWSTIEKNTLVVIVS